MRSYGSERQNGVAAVPALAGDTSTSLCVIRLICQPWLPKRKRLADARFPDEFFVEFADQRAGIVVAQVEVTAIGNRAAGVVQRIHGAFRRVNRLFDAIEYDARFQVAQTRTGVAPRQHFDDEIELFARQASDTDNSGAAARRRRRRATSATPSSIR